MACVVLALAACAGPGKPAAQQPSAGAGAATIEPTAAGGERPAAVVGVAALAQPKAQLAQLAQLADGVSPGAGAGMTTPALAALRLSLTTSQLRAMARGMP